MKGIYEIKREFQQQLNEFAEMLENYISDANNQWVIKGFIDIFQNIYPISADTKILSKVLEIQLFPKFLEFAKQNDYEIVLTEHQNWYPDISFISKSDAKIKFAVDLKTTYSSEKSPEFCNGFTLGSHGTYFIDRKSSKNIQFPYSEYVGHYCLGIIYSRAELNKLQETETYELKELSKIPSVIRNFIFFACEKWTIASDKSGSGNTANIGSIKRISDILAGNGAFKNLGEEWFDDYWINYGKISIKNDAGIIRKITTLSEFLKYRGKDKSLYYQPTGRKNKNRKHGKN
ncbi:MAG: restriction endonuclease [Beggiatoa sp. IS2]|nr:MAG: restriction endonuclease [Beggiatoa sp. IS2]